MAYEPTLDDVLNSLYGSQGGIADDEIAQLLGESEPTAAAQSSPQSASSYTGGRGKGPESLYIIRDRLIERGIPPHVAAGIVGGLMQESGGRTGVTNSIGAYGAAQWLGNRLHGGSGYTGLIPYAKMQGMRQDDPRLQADYIVHELQGPENRALQRMLATSTPEEAAVAARKYYERPGVHEANDPNRIKWANTFYGTSPSAAQPSQPSQPQLQTITLSDGSTVDVEPGADMAALAAALKDSGIDAEPMRQVALPDGSYVDAPYSYSDEQVLEGMRQVNKPAVADDSKKGHLAAGISSFESGVGSALRGLGGAGEYLGQQFDSPMARAAGEYLTGKGQEWSKKGQEAYEPLTPEEVEALGPMGKVRKYVTEPLAGFGGSALATIPAMALPGGAATRIGAFTAQELGGQLERQEAEGQTADVEKAAPWALASGVVQNHLLGPLKYVNNAFGKPTIQAELKRITETEGAEAARDYAKGLATNIFKEVGINTGEVIGSETLSSLASRAAAGLDLTSPEALEEYIQTAIESAPGGLFGVPAGFGRHAVQQGVIEGTALSQKIKQADEQRRLDEEAAGIESSEAAQKRQEAAAELERQAGIGVEVPSAEVNPPVQEPVAPPVPPSAAAAPSAEVASAPVQEITPEVTPEAPKHFSDALGIASKTGKKKDIPLKKALEQLDINNPEHHTTIANALEEGVKLAEQGKIQLDIPKAQEFLNSLKPPEVQDASQIESAKPFDAGRSKLPEGGEEIGRAPVSGEGIRASDQEGKGIAGEGQEEGPVIPKETKEPVTDINHAAYQIVGAPAYETHVPLLHDAALFELEVLQEAAKKGKLTQERFANSEIGQRLDTGHVSAIGSSIKQGDYSALDQLVERIRETKEHQITPEVQEVKAPEVQWEKPESLVRRMGPTPSWEKPESLVRRMGPTPSWEKPTAGVKTSAPRKTKKVKEALAPEDILANKITGLSNTLTELHGQIKAEQVKAKPSQALLSQYTTRRQNAEQMLATLRRQQTNILNAKTAERTALNEATAAQAREEAARKVQEQGGYELDLIEAENKAKKAEATAVKAARAPTAPIKPVQQKLREVPEADDLIKRIEEMQAKKAEAKPEVKATEKPPISEKTLTPLQARAKFGKDIGAVVEAGGQRLRDRVNKKAASAIEAGDTKGTIAALKESKNPVVRWVAEKADLIDGLKVKADEEAQETKLSKAVFANEALRYRLGVLDALRDFRNKHADIGENGRIPYAETSARNIFKKGDFDPNGYFAEAENTSLHGALNTELRGRETVLNVKLKDLDEAIANIENDFTSSGRTEEEARQAAGLLPRNIMAVGGAYDRSANMVKIDPYYAKNEGVIAHELVHAVVSHAIDKPTPKQRPAVHSLKKLHEAVKDHESIKGEYGVTNIHEFVSEGLSNPDFQQKLSKIKYEATTAWGKFTDSIANLLGLKKDNAFMELLALSEQLAPSKPTKPEGKGEFPSLQKSYPKEEKPLVKESEPDSIVKEGIRAATDVMKKGAWTHFEGKLVNRHAFLEAFVKDMSTFEDGKLRSDLQASVFDQIYNTVSAGVTEGIPVFSKDDTVMIQKDQKRNLSNIAKAIDKLKVKNPRIYFSEIARALRGEEILKEDIELQKKINTLSDKAQKLEAHAKTLSYAEGKKHAALAKQYKEEARKLQSRIGEEGREKLVTEEHIAEARRRLAEHPEIQPILDDIHGLMKSLVDLWEVSGLVSKDVANEWRSKPSYIPLYMAQEDLLRDPSKAVKMMGGGVKSLPNVKRLKGGTQAINLLENLNRHYAFMTTAAAQNMLRKNAARDMELFGSAQRTNPEDKQAIMFKEGGKEIYYRVADPMALEAMQAASIITDPILKAAREYTKVFRAVTLINPLYWYRQLIRDPLHANVVSKTGIVTPIGAAISFAKIIANASKEYGELKRRGIVGAVDALSDPARFKRTYDKNPGLFRKGADWVMHVHEAADAATRVEVYKAGLKEAKQKGMSGEDAKNFAAMRAREIINFAHQGSAQSLQAIRATVPFFSAALNSLNSVARAATGKGLNKAEAAEARRLFTSRALMIASYTTAYALAMQDDEDYLKSPDAVNNWLIPTGDKDKPFWMIPLPFELGFVTKVIPELMVRLNSGTLRPYEAKKMLKEAAFSTLVPPLPFPQLAKPLAEAALNVDMHTGRQIVGAGQARLAPSEQTRGASALSIELGRKLGLSPAQVEHFMRGYLTDLWTTVGVMSDAFLPAGAAKEERYLGEVPTIIGGGKGIVTVPEKDRAVDTFYELHQAASQIKDSITSAEHKGDFEAMDRILNDPELSKKFYAAPAGRDIAEQMSKVETAISQIRNSNLSKPEKREQIREYRNWYNDLAERGVALYNSLGIEEP